MEERRPQKLAAILHADVVGSTALVQKNQALAHDRIQDAFRRFSDTIRAYGGVAHELRGDALVAEFDRASAAVCAALAFQSGNVKHNAALDDEIRPQLRVGIGMGEVVIADNTLTGAGVVLAQRLEQLAEADGVCIQGAAYETIPSQLPFAFEPLGEQIVKGFAQPVRAFAVSLSPGAVIPPPERSRRNRHKWFAAAAVLFALIIAGGLVWFQPWAPREEPASVERMAFPLPEKTSIAVLPLDNLSGDAEQEYVSDGLTENIITVLSQVPEMFVIARNSTFAYKDAPVKVQQVAEELGVRYVVEGSFQREGDQIRIHVQLIDALSGRHIWAQRFDRTFAGIFALQDDVTRNVVSALEMKLTEEQKAMLAQHYTHSVDAYDYFLRGQSLFSRLTKDDNALARAMYRRAIELDSGFARAYGALAMTHAFDFRFGWSEDTAASLQQALELARRAIQIDDSLPQVHWVSAQTLAFNRQHVEAIQAAEKATALDANYADAYALLAAVQTFAGRADLAIPAIDNAMRLNPRPFAFYSFIRGRALFFLGRLDEARTALRTAVELNAHYLLPQAYLTATYGRLGATEDAQWQAAEILALEPGFSIQTWTENRILADSNYIERLSDGLRKAGLPDRPPLPLPDKPSIAVLPFTNMSGNPEQEYFADGIAEDLTTDLSKISGLFVISRNSAFTYKNKTAKPEEVARELGVRYVVEGSVRRAGEQVRINAQLIDATTGGHLWAERYDGSTSDVFDLQDKVTRKIVTALAVELREGQLQRTGETENVDAYDAFMKGWMLYRTDTPQGFVDAIPHFEKAVSLDPGYGRAYAALAAVYYLGYWRNWQKPFDVLPEIREFTNDLGFVTLAFEYLDKSFVNPSPLSYILRAETLLNQPEHEAALLAAQEAVALDPNEPDSYVQLARVLTMMGRAEEAIPLIEKAMRLNPYFPASYLSALGLAYFGLEDFEKAVSVSRQAVKLSPYQSPLALIASYGHLDRSEEALPHIDNLREQLRTHLPGYPATVRVLVNWRFPLFQHLNDRQRLIEGLRKAGLP